ncbi:hypothetical protein BKA64DRAFT_675983 [Cadophora sp. MPI-SDFR-AT-0126]|nr:hypothetical protein BKA64DRAFT_675983 [Leotiomycetes sp. MPI-SDFR-AT-0126]
MLIFPGQTFSLLIVGASIQTSMTLPGASLTCGTLCRIGQLQQSMALIVSNHLPEQSHLNVPQSPCRTAVCWDEQEKYACDDSSAGRALEQRSKIECTKLRRK